MKELEKLLFPISVSEFFEKYYEKEVLHQAGSEASVFNSFKVDFLDHILTYNQLSYPEIMIYKQGEKVHDSLYQKVAKTGRNTIADVDKVLELIKKGHSLILNGLDRREDHLNTFCRALESELEMEVQGNLYLTPAKNRGFDIHFDSHDVFILQLKGSKKWKVYESDIPLISDQLEVQKRQNDSFVEINSFTLQEGHFLYIPRGIYHQAESTDENSIHITLGMFPLIGYQLLEQLAIEVQKDSFFRKAIPASWNSKTKKTAFLNQFIKNVEEILTTQNIEKLIESKKIALLKRQKANHKGLLSNLMNEESINERSVISIKKSKNIQLKENNKLLWVYTPGRVVKLPIFIKPLINRLLEGEKLMVGDIHELPTHEQRLKAVKYLLFKGLIELSD